VKPPASQVNARSIDAARLQFFLMMGQAVRWRNHLDSLDSLVGLRSVQ
jgi:hypothetical protein